ncbi:ankyrin repeat-containing domain protein [Colletotrichum navitas]|uniref:Ankyrin repeat-containing domain protein n=1 Tax=Colletotrichum navitas TaxID=681940 RepID=A0AAD8PNG8_9PEZI|nr:ankyrin repeat-containing domain protein [Colletotrichum navitas]KAK1573064.1 ankyrin repeat-containing domain protein [Colletotrichum navitas]
MPMTRRKEKSQAQIEHVNERRRTQNRIAQRRYRERQKQFLENAHKMLLAHEAMQKQCHMIEQSSYSSWLDTSLEASSSIDLEHCLDIVPAKTQQSSIQIGTSGRNASVAYGSKLGDLDLDLDFRVPGVDMPGPAQARTPPAPSNDTIYVRANEPQAGKDTSPRAEVVATFTPVSPSDFFQFSSSPGSDTFDPLLGVSTESLGEPSTNVGINTPSTSQCTTSPSGLGESRRLSAHTSPNPLDSADQSGPTEEDAAFSLKSQLARRPSASGHHDGPATAGRHLSLVDDDEWSTPLLAAAARGHVQIVKLLAQNGADLERKSKSGKSSLFWAVEMRQMETVKCCLDLGANLGAVQDESGLGLFHSAVLKDDISLLTVLLECCANLGENGRKWVHMKDQQNRTPLYLAAELGKTEIAELFVKAGADVNQR